MSEEYIPEEQEYYPRGEKQEKEDEKQSEKGEKDQGEKNWEEKWRSDPVGAASWAAILIWAGLAMLLGNLGFWSSLGLTSDPGPFIFIGAGAILLIQILVRLAIPEHRRPIYGRLILAVVLIGLGLDQLTNVEITVPVIIIGVGLLLLLRGLFQRN